MHIQWYPGHMTKARRMMQEHIKLIDIVIELVDARVPYSSKNPDIDQLAGSKVRLIILNKADMADPAVTALWEDYYRDRGFYTAQVNSRSGAGMKEVKKLVDRACQEKKERDKKRGILNRPVRAMVAGIPNVGKSTFINTFAGKACAKTGNMRLSYGQVKISGRSRKSGFSTEYPSSIRSTAFIFSPGVPYVFF